MKCLIIFVAIFIATLDAQNPTLRGIYSDQACPIPPPPHLTSIDVARLEGEWFFIEAYPSFYFQGLDCYSATYVQTGSNSYNNSLCEQINGVKTCRSVQTVIDADGRNWVVLEGRTSQAQGGSYYLDIDYDNFFIFYICNNLSSGGSQTTLFIISKTRTLDKKFLHDAHKIIKKDGYDTDALVTINQDPAFCSA